MLQAIDLKRSMDGAGNVFRVQEGDHALDLPPAAEMDHIAERAAAIGALSGLELGEFAEGGDEIGRVGNQRSILNMNMVVQAYPALPHLVALQLAASPFQKGASPS